MTEWTPEGQAGQAPKYLGLRIIRTLRETFVVNEMRFLLVLECLSQSLSGAALNLSTLARLPLWIWHSHRFLSWDKRCLRYI